MQDIFKYDLKSVYLDFGRWMVKLIERWVGKLIENQAHASILLVFDKLFIPSIHINWLCQNACVQYNESFCLTVHIPGVIIWALGYQHLTLALKQFLKMLRPPALNVFTAQILKSAMSLFIFNQNMTFFLSWNCWRVVLMFLKCCCIPLSVNYTISLVKYCLYLPDTFAGRVVAVVESVEQFELWIILLQSFLYVCSTFVNIMQNWGANICTETNGIYSDKHGGWFFKNY